MKRKIRVYEDKKDESSKWRTIRINERGLLNAVRRAGKYPDQTGIREFDGKTDEVAELRYIRSATSGAGEDVMGFITARPQHGDTINCCLSTYGTILYICRNEAHTISIRYSAATASLVFILSRTDMLGLYNLLIPVSTTELTEEIVGSLSDCLEHFLDTGVISFGYLDGLYQEAKVRAIAKEMSEEKTKEQPVQSYTFDAETRTGLIHEGNEYVRGVTIPPITVRGIAPVRGNPLPLGSDLGTLTIDQGRGLPIVGLDLSRAEINDSTVIRPLINRETEETILNVSDYGSVTQEALSEFIERQLRGMAGITTPAGALGIDRGEDDGQ